VKFLGGLLGEAEIDCMGEDVKVKRRSGGEERVWRRKTGSRVVTYGSKVVSRARFKSANEVLVNSQSFTIAPQLSCEAKTRKL
jgi:hypothetical protein